MTRKGQLTVAGTQQDESGGEQTTLTAAAEYYTRNGSFYILYEESAADGGEITKNMIKLKGSTLELTKRGAVNARMIFEPGQEHVTLYSTPFGTLPLGICTDTVESVLSEKEIEIRAAYSLTNSELSNQNPCSQGPASQGSPASQGGIISRCTIFIKMLFQD